ncbi:MAG TPA: helix-turn-helix transcriptional regulator [Gammaproteobacteria bacterium]
MNVDLHRQQLTEFLKGCRARLSPAHMGLPDQGRRRTPGLRREDVAALAGVSVTWYTWLEQARDIKVSADVLDRICSTLRMSNEERDYLFALVQHRAPPHAQGIEGLVTPALQRMLDALTVPALIKTARWDVIAWNALINVFRDYGRLPPERRNLLRLLLVDDTSYQNNPEGYYTTARRVLSKFRVDYSQYCDDPAFDELIEGLNRDSAIFRELWNTPEVMNRSEAVAYHPQLGGLWFEHTSYVPEGSPTLRLVIFVPHDAKTAATVAALGRSLGSPAAGARPLSRERGSG